MMGSNLLPKPRVLAAAKSENQELSKTMGTRQALRLCVFLYAFA